MKSNNKTFLGIVGIITILLITIGISYAFFTANLTGEEETTTITVIGGTMNITFNGGPNINMINLIPGDNPAASKEFTVTGNNTTDVEMQYKIILVVESNDFTEEALKYTLLSTNTDSNGTVVPSIDTLTNFGTGAKTIELGIGKFASPTEGNKIHTYNLKIYFPNTGENQNEDQGKEIKAFISVENYDPCMGGNCLNDKILAQEGGAAAIEAKGSANFTKIAVSQSEYDSLPTSATGYNLRKSDAVIEVGIYAAEDEYGTSYYYRGGREDLNNNLIFGGFQWKVIRINGDGSTRLLYNGTEEQFNLNNTFNTNSNTNISTTRQKWSTTTYVNDAKYVGYMYCTSTPSTSRNGTASTSATNNQTSPNAKVLIDNWYRDNILNKSFEEKIVDNLFCNDRQLLSEVGGGATGPGYGNTGVHTHYAAYNRVITNKTPTLKCAQQNDRFTKNDQVIGNGALIYPVGLLTIDEAAMSGMMYQKNNTTIYMVGLKLGQCHLIFCIQSLAGHILVTPNYGLLVVPLWRFQLVILIIYAQSLIFHQKQ